MPVYNGRMKRAGLGLIVLVALSGCHKADEKHAEALRLLRNDMIRNERRLAKIEGQLKENINDVGLKTMLNEEQELVKSRLARLHHNWRTIHPEDPPPVWDGKAEEEEKKGFSEEQNRALKSTRKKVLNQANAPKSEAAPAHH